MRVRPSNDATEFALFWVRFALTIYCWVWDLLLRVVPVPSEPPLEKAKLHLQWLLVGDGFWVRDGGCVHFSQHWDSAWHRLVLLQSLRVPTHIIDGVLRTCSLPTAHPRWHLHSASFSTRVPEPGGEDFDANVPLTECSKVSHSTCTIQLWDCVSVPICCRWWWLVKVLIYMYV